MIGIVIPSRGLIHSRTVESIMAASLAWTAKYPTDVIRFSFSHDRPIPECFNAPAAALLLQGADYLTIIEEDVVVPEDAILAMRNTIKQGFDIAYYDAPADSGRLQGFQVDGKEYGGTCAIMLNLHAARLTFPLTAANEYNRHTMELMTTLSDEAAHANKFGGQDIELFHRAHKHGLRMKCVGIVEHLRVVDRPAQRKLNNGVIKIEPIEVIE